MNQFDYISVMLSILVAFAMSEILLSWGKMIRQRHRIKFWWPHSLWTFLVMLLLIQMWWGFWAAHEVEAWNFLSFGILLAQPLTLILAIFVITPHVPEVGTLDLREYYWRNNKGFFLLGMLVIVLFTIGGVFMAGRPALSIENAIRLPAIALLLWLAFSKSERLHVIVLLLSCVLLIIFLLRSSPMLS